MKYLINIEGLAILKGRFNINFSGAILFIGFIFATDLLRLLMVLLQFLFFSMDKKGQFEAV
jgi:hypothetical protein